MTRPLRSALPLLLVALAGWAAGPMRLTVSPTSALTIAGTSTVHDWTCAVPGVSGTVTTDDGAAHVHAAHLAVDATAIDCRNGTMNRKAQAALATKAHPAITFTLDAAALRGAPAAETFTLRATGRLSLAGVTRTIEADVEGRRLADGGVRYTGRLPLLMSDYGIAPPTAMLGALKTGDAVVVTFDLHAAR